jgi:hypothetical protein
MGINQLGAFGINPSPRAFFVNSNAGQQQQVQTNGGPFQFMLKPTQAVHVPAGNWLVQAGQYSNLQQWDSSSYLWRFLSGFDQVPYMVSSDGSNLQVVNTSGGVIGAIVTNKGSAVGTTNGFYGYNQALQFVQIQGNQITTGLTPATAVCGVTTTGGALMNVFIGGSVNTSVTITNGGSGFAEAPTLVVVPPTTQGVQPYIPATATCTIAGGVINAVTITNQGAGYVAAPTILVVPQEGDTLSAWSTTVLTTTLTNVNQVSAVTVASPGTAQFTSVPTLTFTGTNPPTSAAATALMNFSITAVTLNAAGGAYGATQPTITIAANSTLVPTNTNTNPAIEQNLIPTPVQPVIQAFSAAGGTMTAGSTPTVLFGGYGYYSVPQANVQSTLTIPTSYATWTVTAGGNSDNIYLYPV